MSWHSSVKDVLASHPTEAQLRLLLELESAGGAIVVEARHELGWGRWRARWRVVNNVVARAWAVRDRSRVLLNGSGRDVLRRQSKRVERLLAAELELERQSRQRELEQAAERERLASPSYRRARATLRVTVEQEILARFRTRRQEEVGVREAQHLDREIASHEARLQAGMTELSPAPVE